MHALFLMEMIDMTIGILGKDNEKLTKTLQDVGKKHVTYGVKSEYFPSMVESIVKMMQTQLGSEFTADDQAVWEEVFGLLIEDIIVAQTQLAFTEAAKKKDAVINTWTQFSKIKNFEEVGGVILFQQ